MRQLTSSVVWPSAPDQALLRMIRGGRVLMTLGVVLSLTSCHRPVAFSGPTAESEQVVGILQKDPAAELAPPAARLDEEESFAGVGSGGPVVLRRYCTNLTPDDVVAFYERELPRIGWAARRPAVDEPEIISFEKELEGYDVRLTVETFESPCSVEVGLDVAM